MAKDQLKTYAVNDGDMRLIVATTSKGAAAKAIGKGATESADEQEQAVATSDPGTVYSRQGPISIRPFEVAG